MRKLLLLFVLFVSFSAFSQIKMRQEAIHHKTVYFEPLGAASWYSIVYDQIFKEELNDAEVFRVGLGFNPQDGIDLNLGYLHLLNLKHAQFLELGGGANIGRRAPGGLTEAGVFEPLTNSQSTNKLWLFGDIGWRHQSTLDDVRLFRAAWTPHIFLNDPARKLGLFYFTVSFGFGFGYQHEDERLHRE